MPDVGGQGQWKSGQVCLGHTDNEQLFSIIRTESGQRTESIQEKSGHTDIGQDFFTNPDSRQTPETIFRIIRTKTRQGQDTDSAVRRRLVHASDGNNLIKFWFSKIKVTVISTESTLQSEITSANSGKIFWVILKRELCKGLILPSVQGS